MIWLRYASVAKRHSVIDENVGLDMMPQSVSCKLHTNMSGENNIPQGYHTSGQSPNQSRWCSQLLRQ